MLFLAGFSGTSTPVFGSKPGATLRSASRFLRSFSSSLKRRYASLRAAYADCVERRELSSVIICGSSVNG